MIRRVVLFLFLSGTAYAVSPVISPSTSAVNLGGTVQYSETAVDAGSWTCTATDPTGLATACRGSINMTTGLYSAPSTTSTYLPQHTYGGIQILPNNDVYNVRIDSLPVSINNAQLLAAATQFGGAPTWDTDFPINFISTAGAQESINFHYTPLNNGTFSVPVFPTGKAEHGWFSALQLTSADHHVVMVDTTAAQLSEFYQYGPNCNATAASVTGNVATITCSENPQANEFLVGMSVAVGSFTGADTYFNTASVVLTAVTSTSISYALTHANASASTSGAVTKYAGTDTTGKMNSSSGIKYYNTDYLVPTNNATDAAGMKLQGLILGLQEFERAYQTGGDINHAFRTTFGLNAEASSNIWPATTFAVDGGTIPFGARIRLKANYNISGFSARAQILLRALQRYGTFNVDGGNNWPSNAELTRWPSDYYQAIQDIDAVNVSTSMEFVNETGIMISTASEITTYNREIIKFQRTSDLVISTVDVVLQGPAVNFKNDMQYFMAGTAATQLAALNNYGGFTCSMSPSVGSITSGCLYTPPASVTVMTTTTVTATSAINASMTATMAITVFPSTGIFALPSQTSNYTDSTGTTWNARTGTNWADSMGCCACDNQASFPAATDNTLYKCYVSQLNEGGDFNQEYFLPNGTYQVLYRYGTQYPVGAQFIKLTVGTSEVYGNVDPDVQAGGQYRLFASTTTTVTTGSLRVAVFNMNDNGGPVSSLSIIPIAVASVPPPPVTIQGQCTIRGGVTIR